MSVTISLYNHTAKRFAEGSNASTDTYKVLLATAATFDPAVTALVSVTATEVADGNGYAAGGATLSNVAVTTADTNGAAFSADNVTWSASGGPIAASYAIIYNDSDANKAPLAFIDFDGEESAGDGTDFLMIWNTAGIFTWSVV